MGARAEDLAEQALQTLLSNDLLKLHIDGNSNLLAFQVCIGQLCGYFSGCRRLPHAVTGEHGQGRASFGGHPIRYVRDDLDTGIAVRGYIVILDSFLRIGGFEAAQVGTDIEGGVLQL